MVYGIIGMINFAHGEIYMIGAFVSLMTFFVLGAVGVTWVPLALLLVLISAMGFTAVYGWTVERVAYRPLRGSFRLAPLISAIGMSIFLQNYVQLLQGARVKTLPPVIVGGFQLMESNGFVVQLSYLQIVIMAVTIALMAGFSVMIAATPLLSSEPRSVVPSVVMMSSPIISDRSGFCSTVITCVGSPGSGMSPPP